MNFEIIHDPYDWFYVSYQTHNTASAIVFFQPRMSTGGENPDGFDLVSAYALITQAQGVAIIITNWRPITRKRAKQFEKYVIAVNPKGSPPKSHLSIVKPENKAP